jgi:hypothetical protein
VKKIILTIACCFAFAPVGKALAVEGDGAVSIEQDTHKTVVDAGRYAGEKTDHYIKRIQKDLDGLKRDIASREKELSSKVNQVGKDTDSDLRAKTSDLRRQEKALEVQLHGAQKGGEKDVDHWKADIDRGVENLKKGYDALLDSMKVK